MDKILITGSGGFIGSHLAEDLLRRKSRVIGLSIDPKKIHGVTQMHGDIKKITSMPKDVTCIVHLAALTDLDYCQHYPKECFDTNVMGTQNMLEIARKHDSKFIFASTSQVFGIPKKLPISENAELHPSSTYAASKSAGELLCEAYSKSYGLDIIVVRAFSIYGPQSPPYLVTTKIIKQIINDNKVHIGNLSPKRDFLHVSDIVSAYELLIDKNLKGFLKFNVGYGKSFSIHDICRKLIRISKKNVVIESDKKLFRRSEIPNLVCDASSMKKLGWKPKVSLIEGLRLTFESFANGSEKT
ncbi:MAG: GDP-mannose 4,6-dehydratase [Nitrosotalea sp.]